MSSASTFIDITFVGTDPEIFRSIKARIQEQPESYPRQSQELRIFFCVKIHADRPVGADAVFRVDPQYRRHGHGADGLAETYDRFSIRNLPGSRVAAGDRMVQAFPLLQIGSGPVIVGGGTPHIKIDRFLQKLLPAMLHGCEKP